MSAKRVAVVGAGISGLVAAAEIVRAGHEVRVFEAGAHLGGHTNTVTVAEGERELMVDTGFIVFNDRNYPNFEQILAELGVASQPSTMSFGVSDEDGEFEWSTRGPLGLFAIASNLANPKFLRMFADIAKFNREASALLDTDEIGPSLRQFLAQNDFSEYFIERLLVPQASSVWSTYPSQLWEFPARFLAEFFENHGTLQFRNRPQWRTIVGGSKRYIEPLCKPFEERIELETPVRAIHRTGNGVRVETDGHSADFDEVVIASHSDQAIEMLGEPTAAEAEILGAIPYKRNEAVLHTDASIMPKRRAAWASWNFHLRAERVTETTLTYDMNRLQSLDARRSYLVTLNRTEDIDPDRIIRRIDYSHPVFTEAGMAAQARWGEISGVDRVHYCGAYWRWGFHEDGAWSGLRVSEALGGRGPGLGGAVVPEVRKRAAVDPRALEMAS
ncbi:MAG: NAD(P)/FAD-dependent oxidoreductase [Solirubrobacterales bacterium]